MICQKNEDTGCRTNCLNINEFVRRNFVVNKEITIKADLDDLWLMFGAALRYSTGRKTYMPSTVRQVIVDNLPLINQKWIINCLRDINDYERDRIRWGKLGTRYDDHFHHEIWMGLKEMLIKECDKREFEEPLSLYEIEVNPYVSN